MEGKPDLIIGNYTDGNLVSSLVAAKLGVTQVPLVLQYSSAFDWSNHKEDFFS